MSCPCTSGEPYTACCEPWHRGGDAPTALTLMRARYCAYARRDVAFLQHTWHPSTRPRRLRLDDGIEWRRLHIVDTEEGGPADDTGIVEFVARYRADGETASVRERSEFVRERGRWLYVRAVGSASAGVGDEPDDHRGPPT